MTKLKPFFNGLLWGIAAGICIVAFTPKGPAEKPPRPIYPVQSWHHGIQVYEGTGNFIIVSNLIINSHD